MINSVKGKQKHIPLRTCIGCGKRASKKEFVRLAKIKDEVIVDPTGKARGRGANICPNEECFCKATAKSKLEKALKYERKLSSEEIEVLKVKFFENVENKKFRPLNKPVRIRVSKKDIESL